MNARRWLDLGGALAPVLIVIAVFGFGSDSPLPDAPGVDVVAYYESNQTEQVVTTIMVAVAGVLWLLFAGRLRELLTGSTEADRAFANGVFGGGVLFAVATTSAVTVHVAVLSASDSGFASAAEALNILDSFSPVPLAVAGAVYFISLGTASIRTKKLPGWIAWISILVGVLCVSGPLFILGVGLTFILQLILAVVMFTRDGSAEVV